MTDELWRRGALELAGMIARKEVSSREVVTAHLARVDEVNPYLNAIVRRLDVEALAAADRADAAVSAGEALGSLHGVPVTVKENIDVAGTPTTQSVVILAEAIAPTDAPVVERIRAAGAIPIGRTNLPDLGLRVTTESSIRGIRASRPEAPAAARGRRWRAACRRSDSATTSEARCAIRPTAVALPRSSRPTGWFRGLPRFRRKTRGCPDS